MACSPPVPMFWASRRPTSFSTIHPCSTHTVGDFCVFVAASEVRRTLDRPYLETTADLRRAHSIRVHRIPFVRWLRPRHANAGGSDVMKLRVAGLKCRTHHPAVLQDGRNLLFGRRFWEFHVFSHDGAEGEIKGGVVTFARYTDTV